jgi:hypothetical protein
MVNGKEGNGESENNSKYPQTYVITAAQGMQNPASVEHYGRDNSKGRPNISLIKNIEKYTKQNSGELRICAVAGSYVNEIELDSFFQKKDNVFMDEDAFKRLEAQRKRESERRTDKN